MLKIGLLSDTHGWLNPKVFDFFKDCDEIWHAGDIGPDVANKLTAFKTLRAVYGNMDSFDTRYEYPQYQIFNVEDVKVVMTHIGGYPNHYESGVLNILQKEKPDLFISGHSHILKVMQDTKLHLLHINPGAAGKNGFHNKITMIRFQINGKIFSDMEVFEIDRNKLMLG